MDSLKIRKVQRLKQQKTLFMKKLLTFATQKKQIEKPEAKCDKNEAAAGVFLVLKCVETAGKAQTQRPL